LGLRGSWRRRQPSSGIYFNQLPIGPHVSAAALAASLADKPGLEIGQAEIISPSIAADRRAMRAVIVAAIDQDAANAGEAVAALGWMVPQPRLWTINPERLTIVLSANIKEKEYTKFRGRRITIPDDTRCAPSREALKTRYKRFRKATHAAR
jgi:hypothetical protein